MSLMSCGKNNEGYKWGESGVCFIGEGAKEKALAVGKAINAQGKDGFLKDSNSSIDPRIDKNTGFLTSKVVLARTGIQEYFGFEVGLVDRAKEIIKVYRSPEEVFDEDSIKTYINLIVTNDHPVNDVNIKTVKDLQKGTVSDVKREGVFLVGITTVTDQKSIEDVQSGKKEVSVGYATKFIFEPGTTEDGQAYDIKQTKIRANHLAIVDKGRCGSDCKINDNEGILKKILIDGVEYEVEDKLHDALKKQEEDQFNFQKKVKKKEEEKDEEVEVEKKARKKAEADKTKTEAAKDSALAEKISDDDLNALIKDRANTIADAKLILGSKILDCCSDEKDIHKEIVKKLLPDMDIKDKDDIYIKALADIEIEKLKKSSDSYKKLSTSLQDSLKTKKTVDEKRDSARNVYLKDHLGIETIEEEN